MKPLLRIFTLFVMLAYCLPAYASNNLPFFRFQFGSQYNDVLAYMGEPFQHNGFAAYADERATRLYPNAAPGQYFNGGAWYAESIYGYPAHTAYQFYFGKLYKHSHHIHVRNTSLDEVKALLYKIAADVSVALPEAPYVYREINLPPIKNGDYYWNGWEYLGRWSDRFHYATIDVSCYDPDFYVISLHFYERGHYLNDSSIQYENAAFWGEPDTENYRPIMQGNVLPVQWGMGYEALTDILVPPLFAYMWTENKLELSNKISFWGHEWAGNYVVRGGLYEANFYLDGLADMRRDEYIAFFKQLAEKVTQAVNAPEQSLPKRFMPGEIFHSRWYGADTVAVLFGSWDTDIGGDNGIIVKFLDAKNPLNADELTSPVR